MMELVDVYQGSLNDYSLSDVLIRLQRSTKTGVIEVRSGSIIKKVYINKGDIVFAASNDKDDRLGVVLLKVGTISLEQYVQASNILEKTGKRLGKILVEINAISAKELFEVVCHQIEEITISLFSLRDGEFEFVEDPIITGEVITLKVSTANIIYRGIKKIDNFMHITKMCPSIDSVLSLSTDPLNIFQDIHLEDPDKNILSFINGKDSLKTILRNSDLTDFETLKTVYTLISIGLIKPKKKDEETVEIPAVDLLGKPAEPVTPEFVDEVTRIFEKCDAYGYYEILGINKKSSADEISQAYYDVSRKYHPDRHFSRPGEDMKEKLTRIFAYVHRAYETLSDPEKKASYDMMLADELAIAGKTGGESEEEEKEEKEEVKAEAEAEVEEEEEKEEKEEAEVEAEAEEEEEKEEKEEAEAEVKAEVEEEEEKEEKEEKEEAEAEEEEEKEEKEEAEVEEEEEKEEKEEVKAEAEAEEEEEKEEAEAEVEAEEEEEKEEVKAEVEAEAEVEEEEEKEEVKAEVEEEEVKAVGVAETASGNSLTSQKRSFRKLLTVGSVIVAGIASVLIIMFFTMDDKIKGYQDKIESVISPGTLQSVTTESGRFPFFRDDLIRKFAESAAADNALRAGTAGSGHFPSFREDAVIKLLNNRTD